jgi:integral membrane protein (TIGR01906 family)
VIVVALAFVVPVILVGLNVGLLASEPYLRLEYARPGFPEAPGFGAAERLDAASRSTAFIVSSAGPDILAELEYRGAPLYTEGEIAHLVDVQRLVRALLQAAVLGTVLIGLCAIVARHAGQRGFLRRVLAAGGWVTMVLVLLVAVGVGFAWRTVFTGFHEVLFPPGTWEFPADSGLIRLFPEVFWRDAATAAASLTLLEALALVWLGRRNLIAGDRR